MILEVEALEDDGDVVVSVPVESMRDDMDDLPVARTVLAQQPRMDRRMEESSREQLTLTQARSRPRPEISASKAAVKVEIAPVLAGPTAVSVMAQSSEAPRVQSFDDLESPEEASEPLFRVRAMYDYIPIRSDELTFYAGDVMEVLSTEDEWYQARLDGTVGYIPLTYVDPVSLSLSLSSSVQASPNDSCSLDLC